MPDPGRADAERAAVEMLEQILPWSESAYVRGLLEALWDRKLTREERSTILSQAKGAGLTASDRRRLHEEFLFHAALAKSAFGSVSPAARSDLRHLAHLLGLPEAAADEALDRAGREADELAALLLRMPADETPDAEAGRTSRGWLSSVRSSLTLTGALMAGAGSGVRNAARLLAVAPQGECRECGQETDHVLRVGRDFPVQAWLQLSWQALSPSPVAFAANAARLAILDRRLMEQTGRSLLPRYLCSICRGERTGWESAQLMLAVLRGAGDH